MFVDTNQGNECEMHCCLFLTSSCSSEVRADQRALPVGEVEPVRAAGGAQDGHGRLPAHPQPPGALRRRALHAAGPGHGQVSWDRSTRLCFARRGVGLQRSSPRSSFYSLVSYFVSFLGERCYRAVSKQFKGF